MKAWILHHLPSMAPWERSELRSMAKVELAKVRKSTLRITRNYSLLFSVILALSLVFVYHTYVLSYVAKHDVNTLKMSKVLRWMRKVELGKSERGSLQKFIVLNNGIWYQQQCLLGPPVNNCWRLLKRVCVKNPEIGWHNMWTAPYRVPHPRSTAQATFCIFAWPNHRLSHGSQQSNLSAGRLYDPI